MIHGVHLQMQPPKKESDVPGPKYNVIGIEEANKKRQYRYLGRRTQVPNELERNPSPLQYQVKSEYTIHQAPKIVIRERTDGRKCSLTQKHCEAMYDVKDITKPKRFAVASPMYLSSPLYKMEERSVQRKARASPSPIDYTLERTDQKPITIGRCTKPRQQESIGPGPAAYAPLIGSTTGVRLEANLCDFQEIVNACGLNQK